MATDEEAKTLSALTLAKGFCSENVGEAAEGQIGKFTSGCCADTGVEVNTGSGLCDVAENRSDCVNTETCGTENVIEGNYECIGVDMGMEGGNRIIVGQKFVPLNGKDLSVGSGFSKNNSDKMDTSGIFLFVDLSNNKLLGKCDKVEYVNDEESEYSIGDFVWVKFNSHPWWPAQIYDPLDASEKAKRCRPKGKFLLVAYFGDGSFSWRSPSQLKPFSQNFEDLFKKNDSGIFLDSVQSALDEIGRVAELKMTCNCISEEKKARLTKEWTINSGIKDGVTGPEYDFNRLPISNFKASDFLLKLRGIALGKSGVNVLELTGLRSCVSAFNLARGGRKFDCFYDGLAIEGIEDTSKRGSRKGSFMLKCDNLKDMKKRKHVKSATAKGYRKKKRNRIGQYLISSTNEVLSDENGHGKETKLSRKRKTSKYLSYPYTDPYLSVKMAGTKMDLVAESVKISELSGVGEKMASAAAELTRSSPILKKNMAGKTLNGGDTSAMIEAVKVKASPEEVVYEARAAVVDPQNFFKSNSCDVVNDFIHAYRTAAYANGSNEKPQKKEQKTLGSKAKAGLGVKSKNETCEEIITISEIMSAGKKHKRAIKSKIDVYGNKEGLPFIKEKLEKMTIMLANCDGDILPEMKIRLEFDIKEILEKIRAMMNTASL